MVETLTSLAGLVSVSLSLHRRMSINALLTINVHSRDILFSMIESSILRPDNFEWTRLVQKGRDFLYMFVCVWCVVWCVVYMVTRVFEDLVTRF